MSLKHPIRLLVIPVVFALLAKPAMALDGVAIEAGHGDATSNYRISVQSYWNKRWFTHGKWFLSGYWEFDVGRWISRPGFTGNSSLTEIGITPVFRLQSKERYWDSVWPYVEAGVGAHLLSHTQLGNRRFSTAFQFGDHVGFGVLFGRHGQFDLGYRFQHLSNADIKRPNNGINFNLVRFGYRF